MTKQNGQKTNIMFPIRFVFLMALCRELVTAQTIPYGKGKVDRNTKIVYYLFVSIPYGKGKGMHKHANQT